MTRQPARSPLAVGCLAIAWLCLGCSQSGTKTHPIAGKVQLTGGDVALLRGSSIELMQAAVPEIRASGPIGADGGFQLKTFHSGAFLAGAPEGTYKARIVLADESDEGIPKRPPNLLHRRYLDFESSGLSLSVPGGDYNLKISAK